ASLKILMDSISSFATEFASPPGTPSITTSGPCDALTELTPLSCKLTPEFGSVPCFEETFNPGTFPCIDISGDTEPGTISSGVIVVTTLVNCFFSKDPYPTTTTSSNP